VTKDQSAGADAPVITGGAAEVGLPVDSLREAAPYLRRPFTPEAIKFKVQTVFSGASGCLVVAYIDARLVIERLNLVVPDMWHAHYERIDGTKLAWCHLAITDREDFRATSVTRSDIGEGQGRSEGQQVKAMISDALKRAAVHFGVGVSVYALPQITLNADQPHVRKKKMAKGDTLVLTDHGHAKLREGYAKWLTEKPHGFGEPLSHGDVEGATIDVDEPEPEEFAPEPAPALEDDRAQKLRAALEASYDRFRAVGGGAGAREVPAVKYRAWVEGAAHSHEEMERLLRWFDERGAELAAKYGGAS
jgi:Rad52/22 family double-strand break repair protein